MGIARANENANLIQIKMIVSEIFGEEFWNGLTDIIAAEKPRIDLYEGDSTLTVLAEAPGILSPEDIFIAVTSDKLNLKYIARNKYENNSPGKKSISECTYGTINRTITLPCYVDDKSIKAVYENGMLEITMQRLDRLQESSVMVEFRK